MSSGPSRIVVKTVTEAFDMPSRSFENGAMISATSVQDGPGPGGSPAFPTSVAAALATRGEELARAWLERVREQLEHRPHAGFPNTTLLEQAPVLVRWAVRGTPQ